MVFTAKSVFGTISFFLATSSSTPIRSIQIEVHGPGFRAQHARKRPVLRANQSGRLTIFFFRKDENSKKNRQAATRSGPLSCCLGPKAGPADLTLANPRRPVCTAPFPDLEPRTHIIKLGAGPIGPAPCSLTPRHTWGHGPFGAMYQC